MVTDAETPAGAGALAGSPLEERLRELAGSVPDPELPMLTLAELGVVRGVRRTGAAAVEVELTPTYTGCPAVETMAEDIERVLRERGGVAEVRVRRVLAPAWTTDDITAEGRRKLAEAGIAPPRTTRPPGPVPVALGPRRDRTSGPGAAAGASGGDAAVACPRCGSGDTELLSPFSSTACKALRRCTACLEPFDHFKELT
ncbi:1,2-phenylacetyl-CoA epoxidase subunit PaaD [Streptomyces sp. MAR4 CNX-425]|uniref:1,2-phenylacetyl-CoA epoxidase subunit PaaD n=1 Tax=Streptomyces sp. MAR4 CNX-425 TaxID=3406343 RepID=UPI003B50DD2B